MIMKRLCISLLITIVLYDAYEIVRDILTHDDDILKSASLQSASLQNDQYYHLPKSTTTTWVFNDDSTVLYIQNDLRTDKPPPDRLPHIALRQE
jgi:hypothetical protein